MIDFQCEYEVLKEEVIKEAGENFSLRVIKDFFAVDIKSERSLSRASSLGDVLELLEYRDLLDSKNVAALQRIGELLNNERIKKLVCWYQKSILESLDKLCLCGISFSYVPLVQPLLEHGRNQVPLPQSTTVSGVDSLSEALENVAISIGNDWPILARELGLLEGQIDLITSGSPEERARQALLIWKRNEQENASITLLDKALESRLCKRKGIGVHLRQRVPGITC